VGFAVKARKSLSRTVGLEWVGVVTWSGRPKMVWICRILSPQW